jgi:hypothetical protein
MQFAWMPRSGEAPRDVQAMAFEKWLGSRQWPPSSCRLFFEKKFKISPLVLELTNEITRTLPITIFQMIRGHLVIS